MAGSMLSAMSGRFVSFALIAGLLLAGCGGSARPDPAPSSAAGSGGSPTTTVAHSVPPSPPPSPAAPTVPADVPTTGPNLRFAGEKPPVMPVAATQHTRAGAVAFAEFFIKTIDWGFATTSGAYVRHYYAPTCIECASHADSLDATRRAGHRYLGGRFTIRGAAGSGSPDEVTVEIRFDLSSVEIVDSTNQFINGGPAKTNLSEAVSVAWRHGQWLVKTMAPT